MSWIDLIGFSASLAVLATFCMGTMVSLRAVAILSNALFMAYGIGQHLYPVLLLHAVLLPINVLKIVQSRCRTRRTFHDDAVRRWNAAIERKNVQRGRFGAQRPLMPTPHVVAESSCEGTAPKGHQ
jgi:hypothetical protein